MTNREWEIIGVPFDFGSEHEGTSQAPEAIRAAGLTRRVEHLRTLGIAIVERGDVEPPGQVDLGRTPTGLAEMMAYAPALAPTRHPTLNDWASLRFAARRSRMLPRGRTPSSSRSTSMCWIQRSLRVSITRSWVALRLAREPSSWSKRTCSRSSPSSSWSRSIQ